ncbi:hypothetical protein [Aureimonas sp. ME7]|uniref:hypothetical protein n=1 Tax=Aureimonas sp. ME7 TaxID=2744252 RepID=UPI0015F3775D|nr:hypothetical protein [Aureimonas sp. ME7]
MPDILEREQEVAQSKWFAYRFASPMVATKLFAEIYRREFKNYIRVNGDVALAQQAKALSMAIFSKPSSSLTQLWKARQRADEIGVPYDVLIEFGFRFAGGRVWKHAPRPSQLFGTKGSPVAWQLEFNKFLGDRMPLAIDRLMDLPQYRVENYRGLVAQDEFRALLLARLAVASGPWHAKIGRQCLELRHLPLRMALSIVSPHLRANLVRELRSDRERGVLGAAAQEFLPQIAYVPASFGLSGAQEVSTGGRKDLAFEEFGSRFGERVTAQMLSRHGCLSPVQVAQDSRRREGQRRRTAKHRAKVRAAACVNPAALSLTTGDGEAA